MIFERYQAREERVRQNSSTFEQFRALCSLIYPKIAEIFVLNIYNKIVIKLLIYLPLDKAR